MGLVPARDHCRLLQILVGGCSTGSACNVVQLLQALPQHGRHAMLKQLMLLRYSLVVAERAHKLFFMSDFSNRTVVGIIEDKLLLLGSDEGGFLFRDKKLLPIKTFKLPMFGCWRFQGLGQGSRPGSVDYLTFLYAQRSIRYPASQRGGCGPWCYVPPNTLEMPRLCLIVSLAN